MSLPININELLTGKTVEGERLEFKKGWNPLDILHSMCAFSNDFNNWGGGYIVVGIAENNGQPVLPPEGVKIERLDEMQKDLIKLCHKIIPNYFPIAVPVEYQGKNILIIWVPASQTRPHKAPVSISEKKRGYCYYIRRFSSTKKATSQEERDLISMSANIPFDDQVNQYAKITDLSLPLIQNHLAKIGSDLLEQSKTLSLVELCRKMNLIEGADENVKPRNIGLLLFNSNPMKFFRCARIDMVQFKDDVGDSFSEKLFEGPIQQQLEDSLLYIKNNIIAEKVSKVPGRAKSDRIFNYPFEAIEEVLANTVYHRSYEDDSPIEIRIYSSYIEMISYPGPLPPLTKEKLLSGETIVARKYRNRRIGDFLKELHLTEGRGTGIPKIRKSMAINGSPNPIFDTDDQLAYFLVRLDIHPDWDVQDGVQDDVQDGVQDDETVDKSILSYCLRSKKRTEIMAMLGLKNRHETWVKKTKHLLDNDYLGLTIPDKLSSGNQQYRTTALGEKFIKGEGTEKKIDKWAQSSLDF